MSPQRGYYLYTCEIWTSCLPTCSDGVQYGRYPSRARLLPAGRPGRHPRPRPAQRGLWHVRVILVPFGLGHTDIFVIIFKYTVP